MNFRVSTIPTVGGEKVVMRLLDEGSRSFNLDHLGMSERDLQDDAEADRQAATA